MRGVTIYETILNVYTCIYYKVIFVYKSIIFVISIAHLNPWKIELRSAEIKMKINSKSRVEALDHWVGIRFRMNCGGKYLNEWGLSTKAATAKILGLHFVWKYVAVNRVPDYLSK